MHGSGPGPHGPGPLRVAGGAALNDGARTADKVAVQALTRLSAVLVRWRYLVLLAWSAPWLRQGWELHEPHMDWFYAEIGARTLLRHHLNVTSGPALHLYTTNPEVQMGPPALLLAGPFQWLPNQLGFHLCAALLALLVLPCVWCLEQASVRSVGDSSGLRLRVLLAGVVLVPVWAYEVQYWGHVDDAVGLCAVAATCLLVSSGRYEVAAGLVLGTGAAAKPWVVILLPMLLAYPRPRVPRAVLGFVGGALVWWLPFVLSAPGTVEALGSLRLFMINEATWRLLGLDGGTAPGWIRPLQLLVGLVLSTVVVRRAGWVAVPFVGLAWRVTSDPYDWPYYVLGPLIGAVLWDATRRGSRWWSALPWATLSALVADLLVERVLHPAAPAARLTWFLAITGYVCVAGARRVGRPTEPVDAVPPRSRSVPTAVAPVLSGCD